jgi:hypothetical protein
MPEETVTNFKVDLPAGGVLYMQTPDEVALFEGSRERYEEEYAFTKTNDKFNLGTLLLQQVQLFRAQTAINGMVPEVDGKGLPTGRYKRVEMDSNDIVKYQKILQEASAEVRNLEKQLGIDKGTREKGNTHTIGSYVKTLKRAAHERGIHITKRTLEYERVVNELRWKLRLLFNADREDREYHNITPRNILEWLREECDKLEEVDKTFAKEKGKLYVGAL